MTPTPSDAQPFAERLGNGKELPVSGNVLPEPAAWRWKAPRWPEGKWALSDSQGEVDAMRSWAIFEPLYPQSALDAERQKREAAELERDTLKVAVADLSDDLRGEGMVRRLLEASLAKANATIERLTTEGLYISEKFSGAAGDIVKLRARIAELEATLRPLFIAAEGLSCGVDWNNGTHAKRSGYRQMLLDALPVARHALAEIGSDK